MKTADEMACLAALRSYRGVGREVDAGLNRIVASIAVSLGMPMAWVSIADEDAHWLTARFGIDLTRLPRNDSLCRLTMECDDILVICDPCNDPRLSDSVLGGGLPGVRFYAGIPLVTAEGHRIGTLSVMDTAAHPDFPPAVTRTLDAFATLIVEHMRERRASLAGTAAIGFAQAAGYALISVDDTGTIAFCNPAAENLFGYAPGEMLGHLIDIIIPEPLREAHRAGFARVAAGAGSKLAGRTIELTAQRRNGSTFPIEFSMCMWRDAAGIGIGAAIRDISEWRARDARLLQMAHHDKLTGLTNRAHFDEQLDACMRTDRHATAMLLDLDGFKEVNDSLGHATGDALLQAVAIRLSTCVMPDVTVSRFGGDEFALLMPGNGDPLVAGAGAAAILEAFQTPFDVCGHTFHVGLSIGAAIGSGPDTIGDELVADADLALYQAKRDGRRCFRLFERSMRSAVVARRKLHDELSRAQRESELVLYYQPQVELGSGRIIGAEALLRWNHPSRGLLAPGAFIDALEAHPLAGSIGRWVIEEGCRQAAEWRRAGLPALRVAVNLFGAQLKQRSLADEVIASLTRHAVPPHLFEIEVTERIALQASDPLLDPLRELHRHGVSIAFDDFGTGYASLSSLKRFPLTRLKIDRSFVRDILTDKHDAEIVRAVLGMAQSFGLDVIAEGIETKEQDTTLRMMGCREGQGYLYGRAMAPDALADLVKRREGRGRRWTDAA